MVHEYKKMFNTVRLSFTQLAYNVFANLSSFIPNTTTCYYTLIFYIFSHVSQMPPNREPNFTHNHPKCYIYAISLIVIDHVTEI